MRLLALLVGLIVGGCGLIPKNPEVEPAYSIVYSSFLADAARFNRDLDLWNLSISSLEFEEEGVVGRCIQDGDDKKVYIRPSYWDRVNYYGKQIVLYHELGHCLLGQDHRPGSIMSSPLPDTRALTNYSDYYLRELFTHEGL